MKRQVIYLLFIVLCVCGVVSAQQGGQPPEPAQEKPQPVYSIPSEIGLSVIAHQPNSPLQIEKGVLLTGSGAREVGVFEARNRGTLPIMRYTVAVWTTGNTKSVWTYNARYKRDWVLPGETTISNKRFPLTEIVPVPNDVRAAANLNGPMRGIGVFFVVSATLSDGTTYSDQATFDALQKYMEGVSQTAKAQQSKAQQ